MSKMLNCLNNGFYCRRLKVLNPLASRISINTWIARNLHEKRLSVWNKTRLYYTVIKSYANDCWFTQINKLNLFFIDWFYLDTRIFFKQENLNNVKLSHMNYYIHWNTNTIPDSVIQIYVNSVSLRKRISQIMT